MHPEFPAVGQNLRCPVCLSLFATPTGLPCGHFFCTSCLEKTLAVKPRCPLCKSSFTRRDIRGAEDALVADLVRSFRDLQPHALTHGSGALPTQFTQLPDEDCIFEGMRRDAAEKARVSNVARAALGGADVEDEGAAEDEESEVAGVPHSFFARGSAHAPSARVPAPAAGTLASAGDSPRGSLLVSSAAVLGEPRSNTTHGIASTHGSVAAPAPTPLMATPTPAALPESSTRRGSPQRALEPVRVDVLAGPAGMAAAAGAAAPPTVEAPRASPPSESLMQAADLMLGLADGAYEPDVTAALAGDELDVPHPRLPLAAAVAQGDGMQAAETMVLTMSDVVQPPPGADSGTLPVAAPSAPQHVHRVAGDSIGRRAPPPDLADLFLSRNTLHGADHEQSESEAGVCAAASVAPLAPLSDTAAAGTALLHEAKPSVADRLCCICLLPHSDEGDFMVFCDGCDVAVHQGCYGISDEEAGIASGSQGSDADSTLPWYCAACHVSGAHSDTAKPSAAMAHAPGLSQLSICCALCPVATAKDALKPSVAAALRLRYSTSATAASPAGSAPPSSSASSRKAAAKKASPMLARSTEEGSETSSDAASRAAGDALCAFLTSGASLASGSSVARPRFSVHAWRPCIDGSWAHALCVCLVPETSTRTIRQLSDALSSAADIAEAAIAAGIPAEDVLRDLAREDPGALPATKGSLRQSGLAGSKRRGNDSFVARTGPPAAATSGLETSLSFPSPSPDRAGRQRASDARGMGRPRALPPSLSATIELVPVCVRGGSEEDEADATPVSAVSVMSQIPVAVLLPFVDIAALRDSDCAPDAGQSASATAVTGMDADYAPLLPAYGVSVPLLRAAVRWLSQWHAECLMTVDLCVLAKSGRYNMPCDACGLKGREVGAAVQCSKGKCMHAFHPLCAVASFCDGLPGHPQLHPFVKVCRS